MKWNTFKIKTPAKPEIKENFTTFITGTYKNLTANIFNGLILNPF